MGVNRKLYSGAQLAFGLFRCCYAAASAYVKEEDEEIGRKCLSVGSLASLKFSNVLTDSFDSCKSH